MIRSGIVVVSEINPPTRVKFCHIYYILWKRLIFLLSPSLPSFAVWICEDSQKLPFHKLPETVDLPAVIMYHRACILSCVALHGPTFHTTAQYRNIASSYSAPIRIARWSRFREQNTIWVIDLVTNNFMPPPGCVCSHQPAGSLCHHFHEKWWEMRAEFEK